MPNNGSQGGNIFRTKGNPNEVWMLVKWDSIEKFKKFATTPELKDSPKRPAVIISPEVWFFEEGEEF